MAKPQAKPGHYFGCLGTEIYSLGQHIARAFEGVESGTFLSVRQILDRGVREDIPKSAIYGVHSGGAMAARLKAMIEGTCSTIPGVTACYDERSPVILGRTRNIRVLGARKNTEG